MDVFEVLDEDALPAWREGERGVFIVGVLKQILDEVLLFLVEGDDPDALLDEFGILEPFQDFLDDGLRLAFVDAPPYFVMAGNLAEMNPGLLGRRRGKRQEAIAIEVLVGEGDEGFMACPSRRTNNGLRPTPSRSEA